jgi:MFS family permease
MSWPEHLPKAAGSSEAHAGLRDRVIARLEARGSYPRWVLLAALAGMFATTFPITILTLALKPIAVEFAVAETTIAWVITAPMLCSAVTLPLLGKLGDLHGHRRIFLLGFAAATATAVATAFAWDAPSLIGLRTLAAVVGGATGPSSMALIFSVHEREERIGAMGWWSMTGAAAPALGLVLGGPLVDWVGWRIVFVLQAVLSVGALALAALVLRETERQRVRFDVAGAFTLAIAVAAVVFTMVRAREIGAFAPENVLFVVLACLSLALFVRIERRTPEPLIELGFFAKRTFTGALVSNAFQGAAYMGAFVLAPLVLYAIFGLSITKASAVMLLRTLTLTIASHFGARLAMAVGERGAATIGAAVLTTSLVVIAWSVGHAELVGFGAGLVLQGLGHGLALPSLSSAVANAVPDGDLGIASAGSRLMGTLGTAFGITALLLMYGGDDSAAVFQRAYLAAAGFAALSLVAAWIMQDEQETPCPDAIRSA